MSSGFGKNSSFSLGVRAVAPSPDLGEGPVPVVQSRATVRKILWLDEQGWCTPASTQTFGSLSATLTSSVAVPVAVRFSRSCGVKYACETEPGLRSVGSK